MSEKPDGPLAMIEAQIKVMISKITVLRQECTERTNQIKDLEKQAAEWEAAAAKLRPKK